jgi:hypothetical protein
MTNLKKNQQKLAGGTEKDVIMRGEEAAQTYAGSPVHWVF